MKLIKIYLVIVIVLLIAGLGFGIYAWYTIQTLNTNVGTSLNSTDTYEEKTIYRQNPS